MGTRGFITFVVDDENKTVYNHYDSYPSGLGVRLLRWLRGPGINTEAETRDEVRALRAVSGEPTLDDFIKFSQYHDPHVSRGKDWYALLRHTQGDPAAILAAGVYEDIHDERFLVGAEWGYVIDFDRRVFEVGSISLSGHIATWGFDKLPSEAELTSIEA